LCERKYILAFCLAFLLEYEKQVKKSQNITFLFLAIHLAAPLEMLLEAKKEEAVGGIFCFSFKMHIKIT